MSVPIINAPGRFVPQVALSFGAAGDAASAVNETNPLPIAALGRGVTYLDRSGTLAAAGVGQQIAPANPARGGLLVQNLSEDDLWLGTAGMAVVGPPSLRIGPGQLYESPAHGVPVTAISLIGAAAGQAFAAREW